MGVGAVLALSVPFVVVLGWISANQFEGFFLKNWRDNEKEYKIYDASVRGRVMQNAFYQKGYCKDLAFTVLMLAICTAVGFCFLKLGFTRYEYCHDIYPGCIVDGSGYQGLCI